jgi:hypothetical protein
VISQGGREGGGAGASPEDEGEEVELPVLRRKEHRVELRGGARSLDDLPDATLSRKSEHDQKIELSKQRDDHEVALSKQRHEQRQETLKTWLAVATLAGVAATYFFVLPPDRARDLGLGVLVSAAGAYLFKK